MINQIEYRDRHRMNRAVAGILCSALLWSGAATAQALVDDNSSVPSNDLALQEPQPEKGQAEPTVIKASDLSGKQVKNGNGDDFGIIKDVVLEMATGRIKYVVMSAGGVLGIGDKLVALPIESLRLAPAGDYLLLNASQEQIDEAASLSRRDWPGEADFSVFESSEVNESN